ncbi:DUF2642 domain-containing protein [Priestia megaterium]|uniref:DUF2642 domain-containing protein n=1 Tax=Priestia megaterium TaxID=1404 RepID=A0ABD4WP18_PRIMG|nr:DUF2642 domain-containing protein [Priestia megaterium]MCF6797772.1 DUF2642 domain-containing protein [Bacillus sp. ET1]MDD9781993.1 DUF2642 domain-containing protein [Priestia megaterium]MDN4863949.1 DUF2642 domain-containing protein [Priestia megaterium]MED3811921.1 DUF2642 domain-containing protein [Priestia megaterium]MED3827027.1 DUF2642 domain-containing protein [Priestia megaterium]
MFFCCYRRYVEKIKHLLFSNRFAEFIQENTKKAVEDVVYSDTFREYVISIIKESQESPFKEIAEQYIGQEVVVETAAGPLEGVVTFVGDDYLELVESPTSTVLLPFTSIVTIQSA